MSWLDTLQWGVNAWATWRFYLWANHWRKLLTEDRDGDSGRMGHWLTGKLEPY